MKKNVISCCLGWLAYIGISAALFPYLNLTVMLASIPLTMLGGWLFGHKGAFVTTFLTIPWHMALIWSYRESGLGILTAFNPVGIISQLVFSHTSAFLQHTKQRYQVLHDSLEDLASERTKELDQLTRFLLESENQAYTHLLPSLLAHPMQQLEAMHKTSLLLTHHLASLDHTHSGHAAELTEVIQNCIKDLRAMETFPASGHPVPEKLEDSIRTIIGRLTNMSNVDVNFECDGKQYEISGQINHDLCQITHEAVSNALQHANPTKIQIGIESDADATTLYIENNGTPLRSEIDEGMGLPLMRYRASRIGASIEIGTTEEGHTRCRCQLPLTPKDD